MSIRSLVRRLAALAMASSSSYALQVQSVTPTRLPVLDEQVVVHPFSDTGPFTSTRDGGYCYAAEGCSVALILADPDHPQAQDNYDDPVWRKPVGVKGVRPVDMKLDPDWDSSDPEDPHAFLYIAAGRDGLWLMEADLDERAAHAAYRIDDSGDVNAPTQGSRRWCNSLGFMTLGSGAEETTYVLALFAQKDDSRLRVYGIQDLRDVAAQGQETGQELTPLQSTVLQGNPNAHGRSFGFDVVVDGREAYVAMGHHGIVKLKYSQQGGGNLQAPVVTWGPYFGTGSPYDDLGRAPGGFEDLYKDVGYGKTDRPPVFEHPPLFLDLAIDDREPGKGYLFAALDSLGWCAFSLEADWDEDIYDSQGVYGAPDFIHEGRLRRYESPFDRPYVLLADVDPDLPPDRNTRTYARHIETAPFKDPVGNVVGTALVVGTSTTPFIKGPGDKNEGRVLTSRLNVGPVESEHYAPDSAGYLNHSLVYDLDGLPGWARDVRHHVGDTRSGSSVHVFEEQANGELSFFSGNALAKSKLVPPDDDDGASGFALSRVTYDDFPGGVADETHDDLITRSRFTRPGRLLINVAPSLADSRLLVTSSNDGGLVPGGPMLLDLQSDAPAITAPWFDEEESGLPPMDANYRLSHGVVIDTSGGFVAEDAEGVLHEYRVGFSPCDCEDLPGDSGYRWRMVKTNPAWSLAGPESEPREVKRLFNMAPPTKFNSDPLTHQTGRHYYAPSMVNEEYNEHLRTNFQDPVDPIGIVWASLNGNPQGIIALKANAVQRQLDAPFTQNLQDFYIEAHSDAMALGGLTTHPEFWNVDDVRDPDSSPDAAEFIGVRRAQVTPNAAVYYDQVQTWYSDLFELPSAPGVAPDRWVLAAASGYSALSENNAKVDDRSDHPEWQPPAPFREDSSPQGYRHMMVRLFDVTDPSAIRFPTEDPPPNGDSMDVAGFTILGPDPDTTAFEVRGVHLEGGEGYEDDRYLLLVTDIGGKLYVYDVGDLLWQTPHFTREEDPAYKHFGAIWQEGAAAPAIDRAPLHTFQTTLSVSDDHSNFISGLEVDVQDIGDGQQQVFVYLGVSRLGVEVLRLRFFGDQAQGPGQLTRVGLIQTPGDASGLHIETYGPTDPYSKLLFVGDYGAGFRVFGYPEKRQ